MHKSAIIIIIIIVIKLLLKTPVNSISDFPLSLTVTCVISPFVVLIDVIVGLIVGTFVGTSTIKPF